MITPCVALELQLGLQLKTPRFAAWFGTRNGLGGTSREVPLHTIPDLPFPCKAPLAKIACIRLLSHRLLHGRWSARSVPAEWVRVRDRCLVGFAVGRRGVLGFLENRCAQTDCRRGADWALYDRRVPWLRRNASRPCRELNRSLPCFGQ
jgi:hypothetical protein